ncbi:hypothetical protein [Streptomyces sp. AP-93]|uniref:hypothetical protein n=1 Tax=Streptomyces sp. AP-93 TaxID=2929048 RepID=UPI001FAE92AF|nr:hypothetical protein [Streptomyces sp. AP-93]MCJ0873474.1 hypothetical protein [Streptomyces sp. AP-93]
MRDETIHTSRTHRTRGGRFATLLAGAALLAALAAVGAQTTGGAGAHTVTAAAEGDLAWG